VHQEQGIPKSANPLHTGSRHPAFPLDFGRFIPAAIPRSFYSSFRQNYPAQRPYPHGSPKPRYNVIVAQGFSVTLRPRVWHETCK
jgi:hypothetical protein